MKTLYLLILLLLCASCGDDKTLSSQEYNIQLIDGLSEAALPNVPISLYYNIGSQSVDNTSGTTDQNGNVSLSIPNTIDSVQAIIAENPSLNEDYIFQIINIEKEDYLLYELFQDTAKRIVRSVLREDEPIIAKAYEYKLIDFLMVDESPRRTNDLIIQYEVEQHHPKFSFEYYGDALNVFQIDAKDTMLQGLFLADEVDYRIDYYVSEFDTGSQVLDTILQSFVEFDAQSVLPDNTVVVKF